MEGLYLLFDWYVTYLFVVCVTHRMWHTPRTPSDLPISSVSGLLSHGIKSNRPC